MAKKKLVAKVTKTAKAPTRTGPTAASIVLGLLGMKNVPTDEAIINAVCEGVEVTKFDKTQLAWYKYQYRQGRWNDGEPQVIRQEAKPKTEKAIKAAKKTVAKKSTKKTAPIEETEEVEA